MYTFNPSRGRWIWVQGQPALLGGWVPRPLGLHRQVLSQNTKPDQTKPSALPLLDIWTISMFVFKRCYCKHHWVHLQGLLGTHGVKWKFLLCCFPKWLHNKALQTCSLYLGVLQRPSHRLPASHPLRAWWTGKPCLCLFNQLSPNRLLRWLLRMRVYICACSRVCGSQRWVSNVVLSWT